MRNFIKYGIFVKGEPLSYGRHNEPEPGLLLKRGRLDVFDTKDLAVNLLEKSIAKEKELGSTWWKKAKFEFIEVTIVGNNAKKHSKEQKDQWIIVKL